MTNPVGRPSLYRDEYCEQARKLCLLGFTDNELAKYFQVDVGTVNAWKVAHPEFHESILQGKDIADADVAEAVRLRAIGYDRKNAAGEVVEHIPGNPVAQKFWLINRQRKRWTERTENVHTDADGNTLAPPTFIINAVKPGERLSS